MSVCYVRLVMFPLSSSYSTQKNLFDLLGALLQSLKIQKDYGNQSFDSFDFPLHSVDFEILKSIQFIIAIFLP